MNTEVNSSVLELDAGTMQILDILAAKWGLSREGAVKRALEQVEGTGTKTTREAKVSALRELQRTLRLTTEKAAAWEASVREGRR